MGMSDRESEHMISARFSKSLTLAALTALALHVAPGRASAESVLRVAMTAADIPDYTGAPDQGYEGYRFAGYTLYDALALWDLSSSDKAAGITPGLHELGRRPEGQQALDLQAPPRRDVS